MCEEGNGIHAAMAALAVATGLEVGRWQAERDFTVRRGRLALTNAARQRCDDGACWNTQAILDLQRPEAAAVSLGEARFNPEGFRRRLVSDYEAQVRCSDARGRRNCEAGPHELTFVEQHDGACGVIVSFHATTPSGEPMANAEDLAGELIFAGHPENRFLDFTANDAIVSIDPMYGLSDSGSTSAGSCSATCTKMSSTNISGTCCSCNGDTGTYQRSYWNPSTYICM